MCLVTHLSVAYGFVRQRTPARSESPARQEGERWQICCLADVSGTLPDHHYFWNDTRSAMACGQPERLDKRGT